MASVCAIPAEQIKSYIDKDMGVGFGTNSLSSVDTTQQSSIRRLTTKKEFEVPDRGHHEHAMACII